MNRTDRILDIIDAGLTESPTAPVYGRDGVCGRCAKNAADEELCSACRAFVLGDSDRDPGARDLTVERFDQLRRSAVQPGEARAAVDGAPEWVVQGVGRDDGFPAAIRAAATWPVSPPPTHSSVAEVMFVDDGVVAHTMWWSPGMVCLNGPPAEYRLPIHTPLTAACEMDRFQTRVYHRAGWLDRPDGIVRHVYTCS